MPPTPQQGVVFWQPVLLLPLCCTFLSWPLAAGISAAVVPAGKQDMDYTNMMHFRRLAVLDAHKVTFLCFQNFTLQQSSAKYFACTSHNAAVKHSSLHPQAAQMQLGVGHWRSDIATASSAICVCFHHPKDCAYG